METGLAQAVAIEDQDIEVDVPDGNLRIHLELALRKPIGEAITRAEMATITGLHAPSSGIADLTGLEFAVNLGYLQLSGNVISDVSPLSQLTTLWTRRVNSGTSEDVIDLSDNLIDDLTPLSGMSILVGELDLSRNTISNLGMALAGHAVDFDLSDNLITDLSPLTSLTVHGRLDLSGNSISDIAPVSEAFAQPRTSNREHTLDLSGNEVTDLAPLAGAYITNLILARNPVAEFSALSEVNGLSFLDLSDTSLSDISNLADLPTTIGTLNLSANSIVDLAPLATLQSIVDLNLSGNSISDISSLGRLTKLRVLDLSGNRVSDIESLRQMPHLSDLDLSDNSISDIEPLAGLSFATLALADNSITDIAPLARLGELFLGHLDLSGNRISDVSALEGMWISRSGGTSGVLDLSKNLISDFRPLANVQFVATRIDLSHNTISDLSPFASSRFRVDYIDLSHNSISDLQPISDQRTPVLNLSSNNISDIGPLADVEWHALRIWGNMITDLSPLLDNYRIRTLYLTCCHVLPGRDRFSIPDDDIRGSNPLDQPSINDHIPQLQRQGVLVYYRPGDANPVDFADQSLRRAAINGISGNVSHGEYNAMLSGGAPITRAHLATLVELSAQGAGITDLAGLEFAVNVREADLAANAITNISQLSYLTDLERLDLSYNEIGRIAFLAGLSELVNLNLSANSITDISPLTLLRNLTKLDLTTNQIDKITALAGLDALTELYLANNLIRDIAALAGLRELLKLDLSTNQIVDIHPLSGLAKLQTLTLDNNSIADVGALASLNDLGDLSLANNLISSVAPLAGITARMNLSGNLISDIEPLALTMVFGNFVDLSFNLISHVEPLWSMYRWDREWRGNLDLRGNPIDHQDRQRLQEWILNHSLQITLDDDDDLAPADIPDPVLLACIRKFVNFGDDDTPIPLIDVRRVGRLWCIPRDDDPRISDLTGLQHFVGLERLDLPDHSISDISVLSDLVQRGGLQAKLDLSGNAISDISALSGGSFSHLDLSDNMISDISVLRDLSFRVTWTDTIPRRVDSMPKIYLSGNRISDLSAFADVRIPGEAPSATGLPIRANLDLSDNAISDASVLEKYELGVLGLSGNQISDISMVASIPIPWVLDLSDNAITDISPLTGRTGFRALHLAGNSISDLAALANTQFKSGRDYSSRSILNLARNAISDVSVLQTIEGIDHLDLSGNSLSRVPSFSGKRLYNLDLSGNKIADLDFLTGMSFRLWGPGLVVGERRGFLDLSFNSITDIGPLVSLLSSPSELSLGHNSISDIAPLANIANADSLRRLYLPNNQITALDGISSLVGLTTLVLANNMIADLQPVGNLLADLPHHTLDLLDLSHNRIVDITPLKDFSGILYLWGNQIENIVGLVPSYRATVYLTCCPPYLVDGERRASNPLSERSVAEAVKGSVYYSLVDVPDPRLKRLIGSSVPIPDDISDSHDGGSVVTTDHLISMVSLEAENEGITDLTGLRGAINLTALDLSGNAISSLAPITGMPHLTRLDVSGNAISELGTLEGLPELGYLDVSSNRVSDLGALGGLPKLQYLDLSSNLVSDIGSLATLGPRSATIDGVETFVCGLGVLDLSDNDVSDLAPLADLGPRRLAVDGVWRDAAGIASLNLSSNAISDIGPLRGLTALSVLDLSDNSISSIDALGVPSEEYEHVSYDLRISRTDCNAWQSYVHLDWGYGYVGGIGGRRGFVGASLHSLDLSGNAIEDISSLSGQRMLRYLDVSNNPISDIRSLSALGPGKISADDRRGREATLDVDGLWFAYVSSTAISDISPVATLRSLRVLDASANAVSDISALADLRQLQYVNLSSNAIWDLSALAKLHGLQQLDLSSNAIADIAPLGGLGPFRRGDRLYEGLQHLDLSDNRIVDISALAGLGPWRDADFAARGLVHLELSRNAISDVSALAQLTSLRRLNLGDNAIADIRPLVRLSGLNELDLSDNWITDPQPLLDWARYKTTRGYTFGRWPVDLELRVDLSGNPLDDGAIIGHLPSLRSFGVRVVGSWTLPPRFRIEPGTDPYIAAETRYTVPLFSSGFDALRQGFVRVINRSDRAGEVRIDPIDDSGRRFSRLTLGIGPDAAVHFNSLDLEMGNPVKGLVGNTGPGIGDWRLEVTSKLDIQVLSYSRTRDGFLTAMHDTLATDGDAYRVAMFNPGSNLDEVSLLRLVNVGEGDLDTRIQGTDDVGSTDGEVRISVPEDSAHTISAAELESGGSGVQGSLGDGVGRWRLRVESPTSPEQLVAMSLLESPTGHLANLSTIPSAQDDGSHLVLFFPSAADAAGVEGFVRVINHSQTPGEVTITAFDETDREYPPVTLALDARQAAHFNSDDLEQGNSEVGLNGGIGAGEGTWRLALSSELDMDVLSYIRTLDGFVTAMHDTVPAEDGIHEVVTFNAGSDLNQASVLRLFNSGEDAASVEIRGIDDEGRSSNGSASLSISAGAVRSYTAADLETGDIESGLAGGLGDGTGKWRLLVTSDQPLVVMSLMKNPTGHVTNISTAPEPTYGEPTAQESGTMPYLPGDAQLPEMVDIPEGEFPMGCNDSRRTRCGPRTSPRHTVTIAAPFQMSKYEITFAQWDACVSGGGCYGYRPDDEGWGRDDRPVINVNWYDARSYVAWLSAVTGDDYRLPSEAEWEYASVAGSPDDYIDYDPSNFRCADDVCVGNTCMSRSGCEGDGYEYTAPVGSFPGNPWGLHDMVGNVAEWTLDCWKENYREAPVDGSAETTGDCNARVLRGARYDSGRGVAPFPTLQRERMFSGRRYPGRGFRVVRD